MALTRSDRIPQRQLLIYNAMDSLIEFRVFDVLTEQLKDYKKTFALAKELKKGKGSTMSRKFATIRQISEIRAIPNAERVELACIDGWRAVVPKNTYQTTGDGDALYC